MIVIDKFSMKGRVMMINGEVLNRKVVAFRYNCKDDSDTVTISCYVEDDNGIVINENEPMMEDLVYLLGR